jgi:hypothetical protein
MQKSVQQKRWQKMVPASWDLAGRVRGLDTRIAFDAMMLMMITPSQSSHDEMLGLLIIKGSMD